MPVLSSTNIGILLLSAVYLFHQIGVIRSGTARRGATLLASLWSVPRDGRQGRNRPESSQSTASARAQPRATPGRHSQRHPLDAQEGPLPGYSGEWAAIVQKSGLSVLVNWEGKDGISGLDRHFKIRVRFEGDREQDLGFYVLYLSTMN